MRVEGGRGRWWAGGAVIATLVCAVPAHADGIFGTAQVQYQRLEDHLVTRNADGSTTLTPYTREFWLQTYDLNHRAYPRQNLLLQSALRLTELNYTRSPDLQRQPTGSMRLIHPYGSLYASSQPTLTRAALVPVGGSAFDSTHATTVDTRRLENQFVGHLGVPNWPQLDASWITRRTNAIASIPGDQSRQRNVRVGYDRTDWASYVSWTDQRSKRRVAGAVASDQGVFRGGASARYAPMPRLGLHGQYDLTDTRSGFLGQKRTSTLAHSADAGADWRHTGTWVTSLTGNLRSTRSSLLRNRTQNEFENALTSTWQPLPSTRLSAVGGLRSQRLTDGAMRTLKYASALAGGDLQVRPGWRANGLLSNTVNWDPERGTYAAQTMGGSSRMMFGRMNELDADLQVAVNGDTSAARQRYANAWGARLAIQPLRGITAIGSYRTYRVGPHLFESLSFSRTRSADLVWKPVSSFDVNASYNVTGVPPNDVPRVVTRSANAHWVPRSSVQLTGTWSRSSQERANTGGTAFSGREFVSGRAQVAFTRRLAASGGFTVAEPGTDRSSKEYDAVVTWSFGR